jgi:hypothetical protein
MPGSFDLNPGDVSLSNPAMQLAVCLVDLDSNFTLLPNIQCDLISEKEGAEPSSARFHYVFDTNLAINLGWPCRIEQTFPLDAQGDYVVQVDDELIVLAMNPDGSPRSLFHGFAQIPQIDVNPASEGCSFVAVGVSQRAFDNPINGRTQRNADQRTTTDGTGDVFIQDAARFNPADNSLGGQGGYLGNMVNANNYTIGDIGSYPVFIDELLFQKDKTYTAYWYISDALKYLLSDDPCSDWITWPTFDSLDDLLSAEYPDGTGPSTDGGSNMVQAGITLRDYDASNKALPVAIAELLGYAGFLMCWQTSLDSDDVPVDSLRIYRRDGASTTPAKLIYLAPPGSDIDPAANNALAIHVSRDTNALVNAYKVETAQKQVEITVLLAPLFQPTLGDEVPPARDAFKSANLTTATATVRDKYRKYGADECGDGHWNNGSSQWNTGMPLDLKRVFPPNPDDGTPSYVRRYRKPSQTLIAKDTLNKPKKAVLEIYFNKASTEPAVQDLPAINGWYTVKNGWQLLPDRLGIVVTDTDPEQWGSGNKKVGDIRGITAQANPNLSGDTSFVGQPFILRLTTVIEDDSRLKIEAPQRVASPTRYQRLRTSDGKDHFQYCTIDMGSLNYVNAGGDGTNPFVARDDTKKAQTHCFQLRSSTEFPVLAGSATIPYITTYYQVGDLVKLIQGRGVSLQTNIAEAQGEEPCYAWITERSFSFANDRQTTQLLLSDQRAAPQPYRG